MFYHSLRGIFPRKFSPSHSILFYNPALPAFHAVVSRPCFRSCPYSSGRPSGGAGQGTRCLLGGGVRPVPCIPRQDSIRVSICLSEPLSGASFRAACFRPSVRGSFRGAAPARPFASPERFRPARLHPYVPCGRRSALPFVCAPARRFRRPLRERFATSRQARDRMSEVSIRRNESGCKNSKKVLSGIPARAFPPEHPCPRILVRASCLSIPA